VTKDTKQYSNMDDFISMGETQMGIKREQSQKGTFACPLSCNWMCQSVKRPPRLGLQDRSGGATLWDTGNRAWTWFFWYEDRT